jgi:VanZ family protein
LTTTALPESVPAPRPHKLLAWLPTLLWLCVLALFSTDLFSAEHTGNILEKILQALFGRVSHHTFQQIHFLIRKAAHFCSYGLLGALAFFSWRATLPQPQNAQKQRVPGAPMPALARWTPRWALLGILTAFVAGSLDEFHQSFVPSRTSNFHDVLLDTAGAIFFQLVIALWLRRSRTAENKG